MATFKVTAGKADVDGVVYDAKDPEACEVESDKDLDALFPNKFVRINEPTKKPRQLDKTSYSSGGEVFSDPPHVKANKKVKKFRKKAKEDEEEFAAQQDVNSVDEEEIRPGQTDDADEDDEEKEAEASDDGDEGESEDQAEEEGAEEEEEEPKSKKNASASPKPKKRKKKSR